MTEYNRLLASIQSLPDADEEEENDPDWDHPDDDEPEPLPAKGGKKK